jgi:regulator of RNase E activity RraA
LANGGREDVTVWGDILTEVAHKKGIAGTVIDGINRDVALALELGYPIYSRDNWMRTGKDRVQVEATQIPVSIGNVRVSPGDLMRGDADGVVVIPREFEDKVLAAAEQIQHAEDQIRTSVRAGMSLREAREKHRYHHLQTRVTP